MGFEPRLIQSDDEHTACLAEINRLSITDGGAERIALLEKLAELYELEKFRALNPDPVDAILYRMRERGLRQADIARWLGGRNRASEILSRRRPLSLAMIEVIGRELRIPLDILISGAASRRRKNGLGETQK